LAPSEADASHAFNFSCDERSQLRYATGAQRSCGGQGAPPAQTRDLQRLQEAVIYPEFLKKLRAKVIEHSVLQLWAIHGGRRPDLSGSPGVRDLDCDGRPGPDGSAAFNAVLQLPDSGFTPGEGITVDASSRRQSSVETQMADRASLVANQLSNSSVSSALVLAAYYLNGLNLNRCSFEARLRNTQSPACRSIQRSLFKLRSSYPLLFTSDLVTPTLTGVARNLLPKMVTALKASPVATVQSQGTALEQVLSNQQVPTQTPDGISASLATLLPQMGATSPIKQDLTQLRTDYGSRLQSILGNLCELESPRGLSVDRNEMELRSLVASDPAAVRQLLVDAGSEGADERALVQAGLCLDSAYVEHLRPMSCGRTFSDRLEVTPDQPTRRQIAGRNETDYPFGSEVNYQISTQGGQTQISQKINLVVPPGAPGGSPSAALLSTWRTELSRFYNTQAGRLGRDVQFSFDVVTSSAPDPGALNIAFHQCWCSTCSAALPAPNHLPPARDTCGIPGRMMQADSSNFHSQVDLSTVLHEAGHGLGLSDEYVATYYPLNSIGEPDSVMREQVMPMRLYSRHLDQILNPGLCD